MSTIVPYYRSVQQLLQNQSFSIDEYQREYKWDKENIDELLADLRGKFLSSYHDGDGTTKVSGYEEYFLGSIIVSNRNGKNYLVDGQQRVTSLTLLLIYLYRTVQTKDSLLAQTIAPLIFSVSFGEPKFNLDIPERLPVIAALFNGNPFNPDGMDESIQTMYARYNDIEQSDLPTNLGNGLSHFCYWLMNKVGLIEIATSNDNYAYAIFETMNDRGKPLSPVDMLKAYLLAPVKDADRRRRANEIWKQQILDLISLPGSDSERDANCIKAWFRAQYADSTRERRAGADDKDWELIGNPFHRWARDNCARLNIGTEAGNLPFMTVEFPFFVKAYERIYKARHSYTPGLEAVFYNAHNDFTWQNTVLLAPLVPNDDSETVRRKLAVTATYLDIWLMRRVVNYIRVGYSSVSYTMWLLCRDIRRKPLDQLVNLLDQKLADDDVTFDGNPSRNRGGINALGLNQFTGRYIFHLLARITAFTEVGAGRNDPFADLVNRARENSFDIEHIWPDKFNSYKAMFDSLDDFNSWRNHVASLLLLPADVNRSLQAKPYSKKVVAYAGQNFYARSFAATAYENQPRFKAFRETHNLPFNAFATFGKDEQCKRRALVEALVKLVWSPERLKAAAA